MADAASGEGEPGEKVSEVADAFRVQAFRFPLHQEMRTEKKGPTDNNDPKTLPGRNYFTHYKFNRC